MFANSTIKSPPGTPAGSRIWRSGGSALFAWQRTVENPRHGEGGVSCVRVARLLGGAAGPIGRVVQTGGELTAALGLQFLGGRAVVGVLLDHRFALFHSHDEAAIADIGAHAVLAVD